MWVLSVWFDFVRLDGLDGKKRERGGKAWNWMVNGLGYEPDRVFFKNWIHFLENGPKLYPKLLYVGGFVIMRNDTMDMIGLYQIQW